MGEFVPIDLEAVPEEFAASTDATIGIEEEFQVLDAASLEMVPRFEELRDAANAQEVADELVEAGVKIIFNYSEALLQVPPEVTVHTSSPAVDLLYALYFYLA